MRLHFFACSIVFVATTVACSSGQTPPPDVDNGADPDETSVVLDDDTGLAETPSPVGVGGPPDGSLTVAPDAGVLDTPCADYAKALCTEQSTCSTFLASIAFLEESICEKRVAIRCELGARVPNTGITPATLEACAAALPDASCLDINAGVFPAECSPPGTLAVGAVCSDDNQCAANSYCETIADATCGTCVAYVLNGGSCSADDARCAPGLTCLSSTDTCVPPVVPGAPCSGTTDCELESSCINGICTADLEVGTACNESEGVPCDTTLGLACNGNDTTGYFCEQIELVHASGICSLDGTAPCAGGALCVEGATELQCAPVAADGEACSATEGCLDPAQCAGGECVFLPAPTCGN